MVDILVKTFNQLSLEELYGILKLRSDVFVVEQNCVYPDVDDKDQRAIHVILKKNNIVIGYTRIFKPGDYFDQASIGRVVVSKTERHNQYGTKIMEASIKTIYQEFQTNSIKISAQVYLNNFYKNLGFNPIGNSYLEDGIPHIAMIKD
jgi:ElaA protein